MKSLETWIRDLEHDRSLNAPDRLRQRLDALDLLDACFLVGQESASDEESPAQSLRHRADAIRDRLETINADFYRTIRHEIRRGTLPAWLREQIIDCSGDANAASPGERYDHRDAAVSGILDFQEPDADGIELADEMVFYQPTPARHVFDLIGRASLTEQDVLVDLGSGLGHVPMLASIGTKAHCIGIEREAAYVDCARRCAASLDLRNVEFVREDARDADFTRGTLFYLYTPFTGSILRAVLDSLRREAKRRAIRIGTYGPCTEIIAAEPWLEVIGSRRVGRVALFGSL